jgi:hypothetical protein
MSSFKVHNLDLHSLGRTKKNNNNDFDACTKFFCLELKACGDEGGGRILVSDNAGGRVVILWPISFQGDGVLI